VFRGHSLPVKGEYHDNFLTAQAAARGVLDREAQPCLFDRLDWFDGLHRMALRDKQPLLIRAFDEGQELWLPLMLAARGHALALANWYNFSWRPVFAGASDEVSKLTLLRTAAETLRGQATRVTLSPMPDEDHSARLVQAAFEQCGWAVFREQCDHNHILNVHGRSFDRYWENRPSRLKNTVKRKGKAGIVTLRIERKFSAESWADYEKVYARSWKPEEGNPDFLRQLAERESVAGALRLGLAYIDGVPVAAQFWTVENGAALIHKLAHDERHMQASPGTLLSAALFQHVIDVDRVDLIDFGTGNDSYKAEWMETVRPRYRLEMFWPNQPANWPHIAVRKLRALRNKSQGE
jgi:Acetyltransferase (GNAT) domain